MRIGPFELTRAQAAAEPVGQTSAPKPKGATGTVNLSGFLEPHEYLPKLTFPRSVAVFDEMTRSDGSVREALWHLYAPIIGASWDVEPASEADDDLQVAAMVRAAYFDWPHVGFNQHLRRALSMLSHGFSLFEPEWMVIESELSYDDPETGERVEVPPRQWLAWRKFGERLQRTIQEWHAPRGELEAVQQFAAVDDTFKELTIPAADLLLFVNEQEGDDFTGVSVLRTAYKHWHMKTLVEKLEVVSLERHGVGMPTIYPSRAMAQDTEQMEALEEIGKNWRSGEAAYVVMPGPKAQASEAAMDGCLIEILSPEGTPPDFEKAKVYHRGEIKGNVLARFAELGHANVGARATGDVQSEVWYDALEAVAGYVCDIHNRDAIPRLVQRNFNGVSRMPRLVCRDIDSRSLETFADSNAKLVMAKAILPDRTYRQHVRKVMDAPKEDEDAEEQTRPKPSDFDLADVGDDGEPAPDRGDPDESRDDDDREPEAQ